MDRNTSNQLSPKKGLHSQHPKILFQWSRQNILDGIIWPGRQKMTDTLANIKDKSGNNVYFGDKFLAHMVRPSHEAGTLVTVVEDLSEENISCDRNFNVEDEKGNRIWNAYMVITGGTKKE